MTELLDVPGMESMTPIHPRAGESTKAAAERAERAAAAERGRLAKRASIKRQREQAIVYVERLAQIDRLISAAEGRKESFAESHVAAAAPLQEQLRALESSGGEGSPEYGEVRQGIDALNDRLQRSIANEDRRIAELNAERQSIAPLANDSMLLSELFTLARPDLRRKMNAARAVANTLERMASAAYEADKAIEAGLLSRFAALARSEAAAAEAAAIDE